MSQRRDNRVAAIQFLYQWDANPAPSLDQALMEFFTDYAYAEDSDEDSPPEPRVSSETTGNDSIPPAIAVPKTIKTPAKPRKRSYFTFAEELVRGTLENIQEIDAIILGYTQNWEFKRIARIDLAILRLALHEMLHRKDIPPIVSINEAIDLSKVFSNADAKRFINGILDQFKVHLKRDLRKAEG
jgi:transcription antitermination protein NusB